MVTFSWPLLLVAVIAVLVVIGFVAVCWVAAGAAERAADWWHDRERPVDPPWWRKPWLSRRIEDEDESRGLCAGCIGFEHCDGRELGCDCTCTWPEDWAEQELPPERTWEQMTSHQLPVDIGFGAAWDMEQPGLIKERRDRMPGHLMVRPPWESEHRAHYAAMGLDYPSGLMARVRELTP